MDEEEILSLAKERLQDPDFIVEVCEFPDHQNDIEFYRAESELLKRNLLHEKTKNADLARRLALARGLAVKAFPKAAKRCPKLGTKASRAERSHAVGKLARHLISCHSDDDGE